jgi:hypothetical protein
MEEELESTSPLAESAEESSELPEEFEVEENEDGSADIVPVQSEDPVPESDFYDNLAEKIDPLKLSSIATDYLQFIEIDKDSRKKRDEQYADAIRRSGLGDDAPGGAEFEGANKVVHPMISEASIDFQSTAIRELFPADGPVRTKVESKVTPEKLQKADRKRRHMNWQLRKQIIEFKPSLEQLLAQLPMGGIQYSKMYYDENYRRPKFEFVPLDDIFIPFHAANFYSASRKTHRQRLNRIEFENRIAAGLYIDLDFQPDAMNMEESKSERASNKVEGKQASNLLYDEDGLRTVFEIYCYLDIEDSYAPKDKAAHAPYILTIDDQTQKVLSIYRNWDQESETFEPLDWIVEWPFIPWRGAYSIGLSHLLSGLSAAATGALRALLDSAHINNAPTAIKLKGAQMSGQSENITVTQIHEIDSAPGVDDIRKIAMPLPFNPPSPVLFQLLGFLENAGKGLVKTVIEQNPEYSPNMPPGTQLNMIEQGLKVYSAIHSRLHDSMDRTLSILHRLNKTYLEEGEPDDNKARAADFSDEINEKLAFKSDYEGEMDVQPVSDPNIFSDSQRFAQMAAVGQLIDKAPTLYNIRAYHKSMLQLMKVPNIEELLPEPPEMKDENPATENIKMATGVAANVLPDQDHLAHIQTHMDFYLSDVYGQNPAIKPVLASQWVNHMVQHMLMLYGSQIKDIIEKAAGMTAKDFMSDDPEVKEALSKAVAAASPMAMESVSSLLLEKVMPVVAEAMQFVQTMTPPTPVDPAASQLQVAQINAQLKEKEMQHQQQMKQVELTINNQIKEKELQANASMHEQDNQYKMVIEKEKISSAEAIEKLKSDTELQKNAEDNVTALKITALRIATTGQGGNFKNGNSLDNPIPAFKEGGLVTDEHLPKNDLPQVVVNMDMNPLAEAIKSIQQPDLSPVLDALSKRNSMNYIDTTSIAEAIASQQKPVVNFDINPLVEQMKNQNSAIKEIVSESVSNSFAPKDILEEIRNSNKELIETIKNRPKVKMEVVKDPQTNKLIGKIEEEKDAD